MTLTAIGIANKNVHTSAMACVISMPCNPRNNGAMYNIGRKNIPWRHIDNIVAGHVFLNVCSSIFVDVDNPMRGKEIHCHLSTLVPMAMSSASSFLKKLMISGAKINPNVPEKSKNIVMIHIVKVYDSLTLAYSFAP